MHKCTTFDHFFGISKHTIVLNATNVFLVLEMFS